MNKDPRNNGRAEGERRKGAQLDTPDPAPPLEKENPAARTAGLFEEVPVE